MLTLSGSSGRASMASNSITASSFRKFRSRTWRRLMMTPLPGIDTMARRGFPGDGPANSRMASPRTSVRRTKPFSHGSGRYREHPGAQDPRTDPGLRDFGDLDRAGTHVHREPGSRPPESEAAHGALWTQIAGQWFGAPPVVRGALTPALSQRERGENGAHIGRERGERTVQTPGEEGAPAGKGSEEGNGEVRRLCQRRGIPTTSHQ